MDGGRCGSSGHGRAVQRPTTEIEERVFAQGAAVIAACDEVGRGALFGDVVVGVVLVRRAQLATVPEGVADSKQLTRARREHLYEPLRAWALSSAVGSASAAEIDTHGIIAALSLAGRRALQAASLQHTGGVIGYDHVLLDGPYNYLSLADSKDVEAAEIAVPVTCVVKGDTTCVSIAAASVLAKVWRDRQVAWLAATYPGYGLEHNVGYGTPEHRAALRKLGPSAEHRRSFSGSVWVPCGGQDHDKGTGDGT